MNQRKYEDGYRRQVEGKARGTDALLLAKQVNDWTAELRRIADLIAAAKGTSCALVMTSATDEGYADVAPQLVLRTLLRVNRYGWPQGFDIDLLNASN